MLSPFMGSIAQNVIVLQVVRSDAVLCTVMRCVLPRTKCASYPEGASHPQGASRSRRERITHKGLPFSQSRQLI